MWPMLDSEPAFAAPNGLNNQRLTQAHADHLAQVIAVVRNQWPGKPVWLIGTSNGTLSVFNAAARLTGSALPNGIVLTSTVTKSDPAGEMGHVLGTNPSLASITVPTLVMGHENDSCFVTPPGDLVNIYNGLTSLAPARKMSATIKGGRPNVAITACGAFHHHGYNGVEQAAVTAIVEFIRNQASPRGAAAFQKTLRCSPRQERQVAWSQRVECNSEAYCTVLAQTAQYGGRLLRPTPGHPRSRPATSGRALRRPVAEPAPAHRGR